MSAFVNQYYKIFPLSCFIYVKYFCAVGSFALPKRSFMDYTFRVRSKNKSKKELRKNINRVFQKTLKTK